MTDIDYPLGFNPAYANPGYYTVVWGKRDVRAFSDKRKAFRFARSVLNTASSEVAVYNEFGGCIMTAADRVAEPTIR